MRAARPLARCWFRLSAGAAPTNLRRSLRLDAVALLAAVAVRHALSLARRLR
jgi:hypothetical protein